ncbi:MAG TPA: ATP-binding protein [Thermoanaerobaculia bacterium]|jgi:signal transduction histidine kinase|nr:ATP-binding protein [Thermoanaerobaculia bacterium]
MRRPQKLGARREILILLPATLLLLVLISTFTLLSLRSALARWQEERCDQAAAIAGRLVRQLAEPSGPAESDLARLAEPVRALGGSVAVIDGEGKTIAEIGPFAGLGPPARTGDAAKTWGPLLTGGDFVAARVPMRGAGRSLIVELPAVALASQLRAVHWLTLVVLPVNAALLLLALFSLQQILGPWERLLARAEQAGSMRSGDEDEVDFLLATFERALAGALGPADPAGGEDDLAALERTLSPSLQSGLLLLDRQGEVLALNDLGAALLGLPPFRPPVRSAAPVAGPDVRELLAGRPEVLALVVPAIASGSGVQREELSIEGPGPLGAGNRRTILGLSVHPLRRVDGGVRGHLVLFSDLTEVRREGEQARMAEGLAQLGEMAAGVAHELRNGLATLRGYLTLIERRPDGESVGDYLVEMRRETEHLERVAGDFLEFARPGSARLLPVALDVLLARAAHDPALGGLAVTVAGEPALTASGDEPLLSRALRNLLLNAAEAERRAGGNGPLEIAAHRTSEGNLAIEIRDRGPGVPPKIRERLFQPFVTGRPGGVGLGLALAYRIVALHGGTLDLADRQGGGTVATLVLPAA